MRNIIICPNEYKMKILSSDSDSFIDNKFMTKQEFINNYYFTYDDNTVFYLMEKYNYNIDVCKVYLSNMYYIDINKDYKNKKLLFLKNLKKELIDNNLLIFNNIFKSYVSNTNVSVFNYYDFDKYLENDLNYKIKFPKSELKSKVYEFNNMEDEVNFVCIKIRELLDKGIDINKIFLCNVDESYNYILSKLFNFYSIPININYNDSIYSTKVVQDFLNDGNLDLNNLDKVIINKKIINILGELVNIDNNSLIYKKILIDKLKNTYLPFRKFDNAVNVRDLESSSFNDDEYVFVLGFNLDSLPKIHRDISYISDKDKDEVLLYDTLYLNKREKNKTIYLLSKINNLTISYKLASPFQKYYPSNLINDLNLDVVEFNNDNYSYSNKYNKIRLSEDFDKYYLYGEVSERLKILNSNYQINYNSYQNKYTGIDNDLYLENIAYPLKLSYTSINSFNECSFKYYINYVLKLGDYTDTFQAFIGSMYHYILTLYKKNNFDLDLEFNKYLERRELSLKEKLLLVKIKKDLKVLIDVLLKQQLLTGYDDEYYEKSMEVKLDKKISVLFIGYIDKIMFYKNVDDIYYSIIDYKSGNIDTNISLMKYGLHMQLPAYLYLINCSKNFESPIFTGIYYQNILFNYPNWSKDMDKDIHKRYLLKGYSTDDVDILSRFDSTYHDSKYIKSMKYSEEKGFSKNTKLISGDELVNMIKYTKEIIDSSTDKIINSEFTINPKIYNGENVSCRYCKFRDLCYVSNDDLIYLEKQDDLSFLGGE